MSDQARVSVIVCAYTTERWDDMLAAIDSLRRQSRPADELILVIDHNPALYARARSTFADVLVVENTSVRGLSGARNTGIAQTTGTLIAFLDDDAIAEADWLARLCAPFADARVLGTGGAVLPRWVGGRPAWFPHEFEWVVGCTYRGLPTSRAMVRNPIGAGACIRRVVFEQVGGFSTELGRVGTLPLGGEETELAIRAQQRWADGYFIFEPLAVVTQKVPPERAGWQYFRARCYAEGVSKATLTSRVGRRDGLAAERTYVTRTLPSGVLRGLADACFKRDLAGAARAAAIVAGLAFTTGGYLHGHWRQRRRPAAASSAGLPDWSAV